MVKIVAAGTSFTFGSALHFYERAKNGKEFTFENLEPHEYKFNVDNSYHTLLANKFDGESVFIGSSGFYGSFLDSINQIKKLIIKNPSTKIVIFQLINPERDFFIYNDVVYNLDITDYDNFVKSRDNIVSQFGDDVKKDFLEKLEKDIELYTFNDQKWRRNHTKYFIDKLTELNEYLLNLGIILQIISYYDSYDNSILNFPKNSFVKIEHNNRNYTNVCDFVNENKLRIRDDINNTEDEHPNFEAHKIVAESIYQNILNHPLYSTI